MNIGFIGKMRAGKDEAASFLLNKYNGKVIKFADPLYEIEAAIFKIVDIPIPEDKTKRRRLLQFIGTEWGRQTIDKDIWINILDKRLNAISQSTSNIFITDIRFQNEIEVLKKYNFKIVKITRPENDRIKAGATNLDHPSEIALDDYTDFDICIANNINGIKYYHDTVDIVFQALNSNAYKKGITYVTSSTINNY